MDMQTEKALLNLLQELVTAVAAMRDEIAALREEVKAKPEPKKRTRKAKKEEPQPVESPAADAEPEASRSNEESQFAALEDAVWSKMKNDYGDDIPRPVIGQADAQTFLVDGIPLGPEGMQTIVKAIKDNPDVATPEDIANSVSMPLAAVYLVQWMMAAQGGQNG